MHDKLAWVDQGTTIFNKKNEMKTREHVTCRAVAAFSLNFLSILETDMFALL